MKNRHNLILLIVAVLFCNPFYTLAQEYKGEYLFIIDSKHVSKPDCFHIELYGNFPVQKRKKIELFYETSDYRDILYEMKDDIDIFSYYTYVDQIKILYEFLNFYGDKRCSDQIYKPKPGLGKILPKVDSFTIQIEALYTFTRMLMYHMVKAEPELIDIRTGETINNNQEKVNEVYEIYRQWLIENEKTGFKNYRLPLYGTKYKWKGQDVFMDNFIGKELGNPKGNQNT